jgi:hypothetical protein
MRTGRWLVLGMTLVALAAFGVQPSPAAMTGMSDEMKTAITHAGFAEKYDTMKVVSLHLHHVINCIVGSGDPMFDKVAGNPCQGQGKGIMPDIKTAMGQDQEYQVAWWLAHVADQAIKMGNLAQAKAAGHIIRTQLTSMSKM